MRTISSCALAAIAAACEPSSPPPVPVATPAAEPPPAVDPLRAPPADPTFGVVVGYLHPPVEHGMLVLSADVVPRFERVGCGDVVREIRGGAFRCEDMPLGLHTAFVRGDGADWARRPIYIKAGELADLGVLELVSLPPGAAVRGIVRDSERRPLAGVEVSYRIGGCWAFDFGTDTYWTTRTTSEGEFWVVPIERDVRLVFQLDGVRFVEREASRGDVLDVRLRP